MSQFLRRLLPYSNREERNNDINDIYGNNQASRDDIAEVVENPLIQTQRNNLDGRPSVQTKKVEWSEAISFTKMSSVLERPKPTEVSRSILDASGEPTSPKSPQLQEYIDSALHFQHCISTITKSSSYMQSGLSPHPDTTRTPAPTPRTPVVTPICNPHNNNISSIMSKPQILRRAASNGQSSSKDQSILRPRTLSWDAFQHNVKGQIPEPLDISMVRQHLDHRPVLDTLLLTPLPVKKNANTNAMVDALSLSPRTASTSTSSMDQIATRIPIPLTKQDAINTIRYMSRKLQESQLEKKSILKPVKEIEENLDIDLDSLHMHLIPTIIDTSSYNININAKVNVDTNANDLIDKEEDSLTFSSDSHEETSTLPSTQVEVGKDIDVTEDIIDDSKPTASAPASVPVSVSVTVEEEEDNVEEEEEEDDDEDEEDDDEDVVHREKRSRHELRDDERHDEQAVEEELSREKTCGETTGEVFRHYDWGESFEEAIQDIIFGKSEVDRTHPQPPTTSTVPCVMVSPTDIDTTATTTTTGTGTVSCYISKEDEIEEEETVQGEGEIDTTTANKKESTTAAATAAAAASSATIIRLSPKTSSIWTQVLGAHNATQTATVTCACMFSVLGMYQAYVRDSASRNTITIAAYTMLLFLLSAAVECRPLVTTRNGNGTGTGTDSSPTSSSSTTSLISVFFHALLDFLQQTFGLQTTASRCIFHVFLFPLCVTMGVPGATVGLLLFVCSITESIGEMFY